MGVGCVEFALDQLRTGACQPHVTKSRSVSQDELTLLRRQVEDTQAQVLKTRRDVQVARVHLGALAHSVRSKQDLGRRARDKIFDELEKPRKGQAYVSTWSMRSSPRCSTGRAPAPGVPVPRGSL